MSDVIILTMAVMCSCKTIYIAPMNSTNERCEAEPCYTLYQVAGIAIPNNLVLYFLPGKHHLNRWLAFDNIGNLKMVGSSTESELWFGQRTELILSNLEELVIENMTLVSSKGWPGNVRVNECGNFLLKRCIVHRIDFLVRSVSAAMSHSIFESRQSCGCSLQIFSSHILIDNCKFNDGTCGENDITLIAYPSLTIAFYVYINNSSFFNKGINIREHESGFVFITDCEFEHTYANITNGGIEINEVNTISVQNSTFTNITAVRSTIVTLESSSYLKLVNSTFLNNHDCNTVLQATTSRLYMTNNKLIDNECYSNILAFDDGIDSHININNSTFINNIVEGGIVIRAHQFIQIFITKCKVTGNHGGAIYFYSIRKSKVKISDSIFTDNTAKFGGAIYIRSYYEVVNCFFENNFVADESGAVFFSDSFLPTKYYTSVFKNSIFARNFGAGVVTIFGNKVRMDNTSFFSNGKLTIRSVTLRSCIYLFNSRLNIVGPVTLNGNIGGAVHAIQSQIYINSTKRTVISNNIAISGGGVMLIESEIIIKSSIYISENRAQLFGGGIYAYRSVLDFTAQQHKKESFITNNFAGQNGGGVCAVASTIKLSYSYVTVGSNTAQHSGGGLYFQENSKLYLIKQEDEEGKLKVWFKVSSNSALRGGGIYVADNSTAGSLQCQGTNSNTKYNHSTSGGYNIVSTTPECFIQTVKLYRVKHSIKINLINTFIINNTAESGSALYGGLLDRCTVSTLAEVYDEKINLDGLQYINWTVKLSNDSSITSDPVQVAICNKHLAKSSRKHVSVTIMIRKGEAFKISISAIDQVGNPVNATIHSSVVTKSGVGRLKEGQAKQNVGKQCTELEYNVFSQDSSAEIELFAEGPCMSMGISKEAFRVTFLPCKCPVGLEPSKSSIACECVCDKELRAHHITNCSQEAGTIYIETNLWISVTTSRNHTGLIIHDCPFDYCVEKPISINLNSSQERDRQCAFNRSGTLCGKCQNGFSVMLATSKCKVCSSIYLFLLIPFALAGIVLITFIIFFNVTIATGAIHSLIFYSNLLPSYYLIQPSPLTVFISWVNLDLGIETCFYNGMTSQGKVLLQLVFPAYLFLLMFLIIILSRYSNFFAKLLSNRNPVAALCTLIFLSYSKLLQFIISALQSTVLELPDGSKETVWLYDASANYFTLNRTPHFLAASVITTAGGLLTLQLFFSQWFPHCSKWKIMKWTRFTKYTAFMDAYHAPFIYKHRYWVGLLLFALIIHNVISAMATNDFLSVLSMGCIAAGLILLKFFFTGVKLYKTWINDLIETISLFNVVFLAFGTLYAQIAGTKYAISILARTSMSLSVSLFIIIICYHCYKYVYLQSRFYRRHKTQISKAIVTIKESVKRLSKRQRLEEQVTEQGDITLKTHYTAMRLHQKREPDLDVLAPITADDYRTVHLPPCKTHSEVTYTIVETTQ